VSREGKRRLLIALCIACTILFTSLAVWQVERRAWKLDLIARVDARVHAPPAALPKRGSWSTLNPKVIEYRRVAVAGEWLEGRDTFVDALTERGAGFWVISPLRTRDGVLLVNRGFVPAELRETVRMRPGRRASVTGLMRLTEPGGRFLRPNEPAEERWYSRDVAAIATARGLSNVAPFFVDADESAGSGRYPIGGLTVVSFRNAHLAYALTWGGLALLSIAGLGLLLSPRGRSQAEASERAR